MTFILLQQTISTVIHLLSCTYTTQTIKESTVSQSTHTSDYHQLGDYIHSEDPLPVNNIQNIAPETHTSSAPHRDKDRADLIILCHDLEVKFEGMSLHTPYYKVIQRWLLTALPDRDTVFCTQL